MNTDTPQAIIAYGREVIRAESAALQSLTARLDRRFAQAVGLVLNCTGRVAVTGIGKAGIVGQKISATLASTGTPSFWLQASEARHGDLGRIVREDLVLILSNSGETEEIVSLLSPVKKIGAAIISITGEPKSTLGRHSDVVLDLGKIEEACPLGLAPSASSTAMLALGDALALTVARRRKFTKEDYALYHPGGELGRKLLTVDKVMRTGKANPVVRCDATVREALRVMTETAGSPGATSVVDKAGKLVGFFTDGDMRRRLPSNPDLLDERVEAVMTRNPKRVTSGHLASEALRMLRDYKIDQLPVVNAKGKLIGILDVQDLLDVGKVETEA